MNHHPPFDRLPRLAEWNPISSITGDDMSGMITGQAKAETKFGALSGRTAIHVSHFGTDSARIEFMCGDTPVQLCVADGNYIALIRAMIANASAMNREALEAALSEAVA